MESILIALKAQKYPLMEENEIVKYLLSREYTLMVRSQTQRSAGEKLAIQQILNKAYAVADKQKLGDNWLAKKGLKRDDMTDEQLLDMMYEDDEKDHT